MKRLDLSARTLLSAVALGIVVTGAAMAQNAPPTQIKEPGLPPIEMPSPAPQPTISGTPLPYPAYGTPAPDVAKLTPKPGVPVSVGLTDSIKIAVALSPTFATQNAQWAEIHAKYTSSVQALYPGLSGTATANKQYSNGTSASAPNGVVSGTYTQSTVSNESVGIAVTQLIFDGGRTIANIRSAKEADIAGRATLLRQLQTLALNVANTYYGVLENQATVVADAQLVHEFEVSEASTAAQIRNGAAARSDIAAAQFQTAQARGNLVTAQGAAIGAQATFATTLGLDADAEIVPKQVGAQPATPNPTYAGSLRRALIMRPDYIAAAYTVQSDQENVRFAKLARFPILSAAASDNIGKTFVNCFVGPNIQGVEVSTCPGPQGYANNKALELNLTIPIYDQGVTNFNVAVAAAQLDQAFANLNLTRLTVESDVRSALATLISARSSLVQARSELTSAQVSLDATQAQYRVGSTTVLNLVTAEANLTTAQSSYISALYGVRTAEQNYLYATGVSDVQL
jgi:outer membrane protein